MNNWWHPYHIQLLREPKRLSVYIPNSTARKRLVFYNRDYRENKTELKKIFELVKILENALEELEKRYGPKKTSLLDRLLRV